MAGCGRNTAEFGNFAKVESVELVQDAMSALLSNYPPAKTRLALVQEADDTFGTSLVATMRENGYAVHEYSAPKRSDKYRASVTKPDGLAFGYLLDGKGDQLRVSLHVGGDTLSRLYQAQQTGEELRYSPLGFWTRRQ